MGHLSTMSNIQIKIALHVPFTFGLLGISDEEEEKKEDGARLTKRLI